MQEAGWQSFKLPSGSDAVTNIKQQQHTFISKIGKHVLLANNEQYSYNYLCTHSGWQKNQFTFYLSY